jgi:hypothetical protein
LDYESNAVYATVCMTVTTRGGDGAAFSECNREFVATIDPDRTIEGVFGGLESTASSESGPAAPQLNGPGDLVRRWGFSGLGDRAAGPWGPQVTLELNDIRVVTIRGDACISPVVYLEARRSGTLTGATTRSLDLQTRNVDPLVLHLRPRYAQ